MKENYMKNYRLKNVFNKVANPQQAKKWVKKVTTGYIKTSKKNGNFVNQWEFSFLKRFNFHHVKSSQLVVK